MYADMEQWTEVRRLVLTGQMSKREACRRFGLHWLTLKKMLEHDEPPGYRRSQRAQRPKIDALVPVIQAILDDDRLAPKKQRHTAIRIFHRLRDEQGYTGGYTTVKDVVRELRAGQREVFLPLTHRPGEAQVDFGFADVHLGGELTRVAVFVMSLPYSDAVYCQVFARECTEVFLEGHARAFAFFGGVATRIVYDNAKTTVGAITGTRERQITREFQRLQSHFLFTPHFCLVRRPNEKGHVERLVEYTRSNFLVPVPDVASLAELNHRLDQLCRRDQERTSRGQSDSIATLLVAEQKAFLPLPTRSFEARRIVFTHADALSLVRFDTNSYSVPTAYAHRNLTVVATVDEVKIIHDDRLIARHQRCWQKDQYRFDPVHYLALLERKPGGFDCARPLEDWHLPDCFAVLRRRLEAADASGHGARSFIRVLRLLEKHPLPQLTAAVDYALDIGVLDPESIRVILEYRSEPKVELFNLDGRPHLRLVSVATTDVSAYGALLTEVAS